MKMFFRRHTFLISLAMCILITNQTFAGKSYSLLVSSLPETSGDQKYMAQILRKNALFSSNSVCTFTYDTTTKLGLGGTTVTSYKNAIRTAYKGSTKNDVCFFFHSGHGSSFGDKTPGLGLSLKWAGLQHYNYNTLLIDLAGVNCKHMIVFINACHSGAVADAWKRLGSTQKKKISVFWSSGSNADSYHKNNNKKLSFYGLAMFSGFGGTGSLNADLDGNRAINITELGVFLNAFVPEYAMRNKTTQNPGFITLNPLTEVFAISASTRLNKSKLTIRVKSSATLTVTVKGESNKVSWKSSNSKIATVKNGKVTGIKAGTATITASANGKSSSCKVTVKKK